MTHSSPSRVARIALLASGVALLSSTGGAFAQNLLPGWQEQYELTLRGGLEHSSSGYEHYIVAAPEVRFERQTGDLNLGFGANTELDQAGSEAARIGSLGLSGDVGLRLSPKADIELSAQYEISQSRPSDPDTPTGVAQSGHVQNLQVGGAYNQSFGRLSASLRGGFGRSQQANDLLADSSYQSNAAQNYWGGQVGGRATYQLTPRIAAFVDAELSRQYYDAASASLSAKRDNWTSELRVGGAYALNDQLSAEASIGVAHQNYDDAALDDLLLYGFDASAAWQVTPASQFTLSYGTDINPTQRTGEVMEIEDTTSLAFSHQFNTQWAANASASFEKRRYLQTAAEIKTFGAGFGVDYQINSDLSAFASYAYSLREETAVAPERRHRIEAGIRFSRP